MREGRLKRPHLRVFTGGGPCAMDGKGQSGAGS